MPRQRKAQARSSRSQGRRRSTAFHEAGHAVAAVVLRRGVKRATVEPNEQWLGAVHHFRRPKLPDESHDSGSAADSRMRREAIICCAGAAAEARYQKRALARVWSGTGASQDRTQAFAWVGLAGETVLKKEFDPRLGFVVTVEDGAQAIGRALEAARVLVRQHWVAVQAVAAALLKQDTLSGREVRAIVAKVQPAARN